MSTHTSNNDVNPKIFKMSFFAWLYKQEFFAWFDMLTASIVATHSVIGHQFKQNNKDV